MKFKTALIFSLFIHLSAFSVALLQPGKKTVSNEPTYYVDLIEAGAGFGRGSGRPGPKAERKDESRSATSVKQLQAIGKEKSSNALRYPSDEEKKEKRKKEKENGEDELKVVRKKEDLTKRGGSFEEDSSGEGDGLRTGLGIGGSGGTGWGSGTGSGLGSGYFPYAYYVDILKNKVSSGWYSGVMQFKARGKYNLVVYFRILRNGQIDALSVEKSSGIAELDLSALRAVQQAAPFPPLPRDFSDEYLIVHLEFFLEQQ